MDIDSDRNGNRYKSFKMLEKEHRIFNDYIIRCECSHSVLFTGKKDRLLCNHCGHYVYRDEKAKLKYKMRELLK